MATITAVQGERTAFTGGDDVIECHFSSLGSRGANMEALGFSFGGSTVVEAKGAVSDWEAVSVTGQPEFITVGEGKPVAAVRISGVSAGSYFVKISN